MAITLVLTLPRLDYESARLQIDQVCYKLGETFTPCIDLGSVALVNSCCYAVRSSHRRKDLATSGIGFMVEVPSTLTRQTEAASEGANQ